MIEIRGKKNTTLAETLLACLNYQDTSPDMIFHHILLDLVLDFGKAPKGCVNFSLDLFSEFAKSSQPTSESSSIQTTEPIVKCYIILEMGRHDLSTHIFTSGFQKRVLKQIFLNLFSAKGGSNQKILFRNMKFGMGVP